MAVARMSILLDRLALGLVLAVTLCFGGRTAHAQSGPVTYWIPGGPFGFGGGLDGGQSLNSYGNFPSFDASGSLAARYNLPNGWFVGGEGGRVGFGMNGASQIGGLGRFGALDYQGVQFGYKFQNASSGPLTLFGGLDTLKYNNGTGIGGGPFSAFDSSNDQSGYRLHGGVEFQPAPNVSLSLGMSYAQQPVNPNNDIKSLTTSPFSVNGLR
jgi:opacity protein-like surface antigen